METQNDTNRCKQTQKDYLFGIDIWHDNSVGTAVVSQAKGEWFNSQS